jgi:hypothetical protein
MGRVFRHFILATALLGTTTGQGNSLIIGSGHPSPGANTLGNLNLDIIIGKSEVSSQANTRSAGSVKAHRIHHAIDKASTIVARADDPLGLNNTLGAVGGLLNTTLGAVSDVLTNVTLSLLTVRLFQTWRTATYLCSRRLSKWQTPSSTHFCVLTRATHKSVAGSTLAVSPLACTSRPTLRFKSQVQPSR